MSSNVNILEIPFTKLKESEVLELIKKTLSNGQGEKLFIATPNPEMLLTAHHNQHFKKVLQQTDLNLPDGNGIIWAQRYLKKSAKVNSRLWKLIIGFISLVMFLFQPKNEKKVFNKAIHGSDLTKKICLDKEISQYGIFLWGNKSGLASNTSQLAANELRKFNPSINIVKSFDSNINDPHIIAEINNSQAEILLIAFGAPEQETWLAENLSKLPTVKIAMGVGGTFDFIAGLIPRAPTWMRNIGLEWVYRLYRQPRKRFKRIINAFIVFPTEIIKSSLANPDKDNTSDI